MSQDEGPGRAPRRWAFLARVLGSLGLISLLPGVLAFGALVFAFIRNPGMMKARVPDGQVYILIVLMSMSLGAGFFFLLRLCWKHASSQNR